MMTKWRLALFRISRRMWFRSTLYGVLGVATALAGAGAKLVLPEGLATQIGADSVGNILGILAAFGVIRQQRQSEKTGSKDQKHHQSIIFQHVTPSFLTCSCFLGRIGTGGLESASGFPFVVLPIKIARQRLINSPHGL